MTFTGIDTRNTIHRGAGFAAPARSLGKGVANRVQAGQTVRDRVQHQAIADRVQNSHVQDRVLANQLVGGRVNLGA